MKPLCRYLVSRFTLDKRMFQLMPGWVQLLGRYYGHRDIQKHVVELIAGWIATCTLVIALSILLAVITTDFVILLLGAIILILYPFFLRRDLEKKLAKKNLQIMLELPLALQQMTLLVHAGETVPGAFYKISEQTKHKPDHPLYKEMGYASAQIKNGMPFPRALEQMNQRCGVQEVSLWIHTLLLYYRRGGQEFGIALRSLGQQLWERRKQAALTIGEEAAAKLIFPAMLLFIVVMGVVAAPVLFFL